MSNVSEANASKVSTMKSKHLNLGKSKKNDGEVSLGSYAYRIVEQQSKQIAKLRSPVLDDTDTEPLHQMRIGTRKLRSALALFSDVVEVNIKGKKSGLSKLTKSLKMLTQTLGNVRDLDVMQQWLEQTLNDHSTSSSKKKVKKADEKAEKRDRAFSEAETQVIETLLKQLKERRKAAFLALEDSLKGKDYKKLISRCKQWVKRPAFRAAAQQPAYYGAAQKIITPITALMEHPGWLVATCQQASGKDTRTVPVAKITLAKLNQQLAEEGEIKISFTTCASRSSESATRQNFSEAFTALPTRLKLESFATCKTSWVNCKIKSSLASSSLTSLAQTGLSNYLPSKRPFKTRG